MLIIINTEKIVESRIVMSGFYCSDYDGLSFKIDMDLVLSK